jgi:hypothetical protein
MRAAARICREISLRYEGYAGDRDNPDAGLDGAFAAGAAACAKAIYAALEAQALARRLPASEADIPF